MISQINYVDLIIPIFLGFREGLEAALVVVIILLYLKKTNQRYYNRYVSLGILLAIISSIIFAIIFMALFGGFSGILEEIFEGITFIISGIFVVSLVLWIGIEGPKLEESLEERIETSINKEKVFSISLLTYTIILREGIELVLLLTGATSIGNLNPVLVIVGSLIGVGIATIIAALTYFGVKTINLSKFFKITNIILIIFAAGLITYGLHELIEAGVIDPLIEEVWDLRLILPEEYPDGNPSTPEWLELVGSLLKSLIGYNANPSLLEVIIYPTLLISIGLVSLKLWKRNEI